MKSGGESVGDADLKKHYVYSDTPEINGTLVPQSRSGWLAKKGSAGMDNSFSRAADYSSTFVGTFFYSKVPWHVQSGMQPDKPSDDEDVC